MRKNEGQNKSSLVMVGGKGRKGDWKRNLNELFFIMAELEPTWQKFSYTSHFGAIKSVEKIKIILVP